MKLFLEKCSFYSNFFKYKNKILIFPDISKKTKIISNEKLEASLRNCEQEAIELVKKIENKTFSIYSTGSSIYYAEDLIITDSSLIEECRSYNVFILFFCSTEDKKLECLWDKNISIKNMCFLGWTIVNNEGDEAITDGFYPIILENNTLLNIKITDLNKYGLLNDDKLDFYLNKNNSDVIITVQGIKQNIKWEPIAVFCDSYTLEKINRLF
ncbi:hypothetical protein [Rodentibacter caecimuris]|uniref:hypothetical protein n=1 Tax=Rodentibacter caecimuris TaxID=1796644 RepID=UPI0013A08348|nr:hypothetical protein [Rodentibacter heylii]MCX2962424.1 hypothetical protein [Rodentibacter heylii]QIA75981.1 hypothetical protein FEE42_00655 [Rodentibacter heylii]